MKHLAATLLTAMISSAAYADAILESAKVDFNIVLTDGHFQGLARPNDVLSWPCSASFKRVGRNDWDITVREERPGGGAMERRFSTTDAKSASRDLISASERPYVSSLYLAEPPARKDLFIRGAFVSIETPAEPQKSGWFVVSAGDDAFAGSSKIAKCTIRKYGGSGL